MTDITFQYSVGEGQTRPTSIVATDGNIVVVLNIVDTGLHFDKTESNVAADQPRTIKVVLAAARWHRAQKRAA